jgi:phosphatidylglycerol:prolipoprotein diacylglycerol transferase
MSPDVTSNWYKHDISPYAIKMGDFALPWYWLVYVFGWIWIDQMGQRWLEKKTPQEDLPKILTAYRFFSFWGWIALIVGARLGYVLFYNLSYYLDNPSQIPAIWNGGMSFHGGFIGLAITALLTARRFKISVFTITDPVALWVPFVLFFGRIANFINGELPGRITDVPWAVIFPGPFADAPRHPSQLYAACAEGLLVGGILFVMRHRLAAHKGWLSFGFLGLYSGARFCVEFFREPDPQIGFIAGLTLGQWLCLIVIFGLIMGRKHIRLAPKH